MSIQASFICGLRISTVLSPERFVPAALLIKKLSFLGVEDRLEKPNTKNKITSHRVNLNPLITFAVTNYALASTGQNVLLILGGIIVFLVLTMVAITALVRKKKRKK